MLTAYGAGKCRHANGAFSVASAQQTALRLKRQNATRHMSLLKGGQAGVGRVRKADGIAACARLFLFCGRMERRLGDCWWLP
jgi:hypothetical protein